MNSQTSVRGTCSGCGKRLTNIDGRMLHRTPMQAMECMIALGERPNVPGYEAKCDRCGGQRVRTMRRDGSGYHWTHISSADASACQQYGRGRR